MDVSLPGLHKLSHRTRRAVGWGAVGVVVLLAIVPFIAFASMGPACGGGYPEVLCKQPLDRVVDPWGMYDRECVSYTAYRVAESGRSMPYGFGDANKWPTAARAHGIAVDTKPRVGDVAIRTDTNHGHSMYVDAVNTNGTIKVSQYNLYKTGTYSQDVLSPQGLQFIHF